MPNPSRKMPAGLRKYWENQKRKAKTTTRRVKRAAKKAARRVASPVIVYQPKGTADMARKKSRRSTVRTFARRSARRSVASGRGFATGQMLALTAGVVGGVMLNTQVTPMIRSRLNVGTSGVGGLAVNAAVAGVVGGGLIMVRKTRALGYGVIIGSLAEMAAGFVRGTVAQMRANNATTGGTLPVQPAALRLPVAPARSGVAGLYDESQPLYSDNSLSGLGRLAQYTYN
jgi:hypothetical protein